MDNYEEKLQKALHKFANQYQKYRKLRDKTQEVWDNERVCPHSDLGIDLAPFVAALKAENNLDVKILHARLIRQWRQAYYGKYKE